MSKSNPMVGGPHQIKIHPLSPSSFLLFSSPFIHITVSFIFSHLSLSLSLLFNSPILYSLFFFFFLCSSYHHSINSPFPHFHFSLLFSHFQFLFSNTTNLPFHFSSISLFLLQICLFSLHYITLHTSNFFFSFFLFMCVCVWYLPNLNLERSSVHKLNESWIFRCREQRDSESRGVRKSTPTDSTTLLFYGSHTKFQFQFQI